MEWKDAKLVVMSNLGGNLRLRKQNELKQANGAKLKDAKGTNTNSFYSFDETAKPVISEKSTIKHAEIKPTVLIDILTKNGNIFELLNK